MIKSMLRNLTKALVGAVCLLSTSGAVAQPGALLPWKYNQPWTRPWASHISLVANCQGAPVTAFPIAAADDFLCGQTGPIVRVSWWGTSQIPNAPARQFFIQIFDHSTANCDRLQSLYRTCVQASVRRVGVDCQGRSVWYYSAALPNPFTQQQGRRYWLQISEVDGLGGGTPPSPTLGAPDFRWSAHRDIKNCPAQQFNIVTGVVNTPLIDPCDQLRDDLAFRLYSRSLSGTIVPLPANKPGVYRLCLREPGSLRLLEAIEFSTDDEGGFYVAPEIADGPVRVFVNGMSGVEADLGTFDLSNNTNLNLGEIRQILGDADGNDVINFSDITRVLSAFNAAGATAP